MGSSAPKEQRVLHRWKWNALHFVTECIGAKPSRQQADALMMVSRLAIAKLKANAGEELNEWQREYSRKIGISIKSGRGTGKDTWLSWVYLWLLLCWPDCQGMVTAPTAKQLREVLWKEISKWLRPTEVLNDMLEWQTEKVYNKEFPQTWFVTARTANIKGSPEEQAETLSGMHGDYMVLAADEASGIPAGVFTNLESTITGKMNFVILISNPTRSSGYFFDTHNVDKGRWLTLTWNSEDSENVAPLSIEGMATKYGRDSNMYRINVLGEFPIQDSQTLIPYGWVQDASERELEYTSEMPVIRAFDVGGGKDKSVMVERIGPVVTNIETLDNPRLNEVVNWVMRMLGDDSHTRAYIDNIGIGAGVADELINRYKVPRLEVCDVRQESTDQSCFRLRDELWWRLRGQFERGTIAIPKNDELIGELTTIRFSNEDNTKGLTKIESKKELRARGIQSPNIADALCMTFKDDDITFKAANKENWIKKPRRVPSWKVA